MSKQPILKKEESIIIDDKNNIINDKDKDSKDQNKKIVKSQIIKRTIEYQSPLILDINSSQNKKDEPKKSYEKKTAVCWNCENLITVKEGWEIVECSECHKLNRIPQNVSETIDQQISVAKSYGNLNQDVPYIYGIAVCPICETENKFRKN